MGWKLGMRVGGGGGGDEVWEVVVWGGSWGGELGGVEGGGGTL